MTTPVTVETTRRTAPPGGEIVESVHRTDIVIVGPGGTVGALGDPDRTTFVRSAAKPIQAAACLDLIGDELEPDLVAISWASHRGERRHLEAVERLLARSGTRPAELTCPPARTQADPASPLRRLHHNCSGKHALFALAGRTLGLGRDALLDEQGALQRHILAALEAATGPIRAIAVDGCGAPAIAVPLLALATTYRDLGRSRGAVVRAGLAHPELIGGEGRLETALLAHGTVAKVGADGVYGAGRDGYGVAVKAESGSIEAASVALAGVAERLGWLPTGAWEADPVTGGAEPVGRWRTTAALDAFLDEVATPVLEG